MSLREYWRRFDADLHRREADAWVARQAAITGTEPKPTRERGYQPKPCVRCGEDFKPTGGRQLRCPECR